MKFNVDMEARREAVGRNGWYRWTILSLLVVCAAGVWYAGWKLTRVAANSGGPEARDVAMEVEDSVQGEVSGEDMEIAVGNGDDSSASGEEMVSMRTFEVESSGSGGLGLMIGGADKPVTQAEVVGNRFFWPERVKVLEDAELPVLYERMRVGEASLSADNEYFVLRVREEGVAVLVDGDEVVVPFALTDLMERAKHLKDDAREAYRIEQQRGLIR